MQWTNIAELPAPLASAIRYDGYDRVGDISVSSLIAPPRKRQLEKRYDEWVTEDVADGVWRLLGSSVHAILERADTNNHLSEERLTAEVLKWTVSGKADLLEPDMTLNDYKVTSVYSFLLGDKAEWEQQLNCYAWLYRKHGFNPKSARIVAILRDWSKARASRESDYPQVGVLVKNIPLWPEQDQAKFVYDRVYLHQEAEKLTDEALPDCTPEERWARPDTWAVKKPANKQAYRVFEKESDAKALVAEKPEYIVEYRPGESVRCDNYCAVAQFCSQYKSLSKAAV